MKTAAVVLCLAVSAFAAQSAAAKPLTVKVTAHVIRTGGGPGMAFDGHIIPGMTVTATYTYDTDAVDSNSDPAFGHYYGIARPAAGEVAMRVNAGPLVFETVPAPQPYDINVTPSIPAGANASAFGILSSDNKPLSPGVWGANLPVQIISISFLDSTGHAPTSDALPATAPDMQSYTDSRIWVLGGDSGTSFEFTAQIDSAEIVPPAIEVLPGDGNFITQQRFDAALLLPVGTQIASAHASIGGNALPLTYPGTCQLAPPNSASRPGILCPDAHTVLGTAAGAPIDWHVELSDGTVLTQSVRWRLIQ